MCWVVCSKSAETRNITTQQRHIDSYQICIKISYNLSIVTLTTLFMNVKAVDSGRWVFR